MSAFPNFGGIALQLVQAGIVSESAMQKAIGEAQQNKKNLIAYLVEEKIASPDKVATD